MAERLCGCRIVLLLRMVGLEIPDSHSFHVGLQLRFGAMDRKGEEERKQ